MGLSPCLGANMANQFASTWPFLPSDPRLACAQTRRGCAIPLGWIAARGPLRGDGHFPVSDRAIGHLGDRAVMQSRRTGGHSDPKTPQSEAALASGCCALCLCFRTVPALTTAGAHIACEGLHLEGRWTVDSHSTSSGRRACPRGALAGATTWQATHG